MAANSDVFRLGQIGHPVVLIFIGRYRCYESLPERQLKRILAAILLLQE
ncbi:MAG: hypothetical protein AAGC78_12955 [Cellvibrio sp.]